MLKRLLTLSILLISSLSAGEVSLYSFTGHPGSYIAIQNLQPGPIENEDLAKLGVRIEITKLDRASGLLSIKTKGDVEKIHSVQLISMPVDTNPGTTSILSSSVALTKKFQVEGGLSNNAHLRIYPKQESKNATQNFHTPLELGPSVALFVKGKEVPAVTRYRVEIKEAKDDTGMEIKKSTTWKQINRQFMWIGEGFSRKPHPSNEMKIDFSLDSSPQHATKIDHISGDLIMRMDQTSELNLNLALGKLHHPELSKQGIELEVTKLANGQLEVVYSDTKGSLSSIKLDPRGQTYKNLSQSARTEGNRSLFTCTTDLPLNNIGLTLTLIETSKEIRVPFELKDLPLTGAHNPSIGVF